MNSRRSKPLLIGLAVLLSIVAAAYLFKSYKAQPQQHDGGKPGKPGLSAVAVVAETALQGDFPIYLSGLGTVTALNTATIRSRVDGELIRVAFREGQTVRAGDLLAEIDPRPFRARLMQAEGQLLRDEALLKNARIDLERYQTLLEQDSIAAQQTATQEALVRQYRGIVETDRGLIADARLQLAYTRITAPFAGRLGLRLVDQGNIVQASDVTGLVVLTQIQPITVVFTLPETDLPAVMKRLRTGESLPIEAYDRSDRIKLARGKLLAVDNQIDTTTGTIKLKAQFDNEDLALFPNQFVNARLVVDTLHDVTIAPAAAIQRGTPGTFVYVVNEDKTVSVRPLKLGPAEGEKIAVLEGLEPGEQVVTDGADKLREGAKVDISTREPAALAP
ncbi:MdtA/MuxA family multidrug efflux RND transporter periplasmic adaptor subunit [Methylobacter marinus]|uniref:MdtA/MuxA family multidrug efflux RND transporter periplasmic adaptor subunit n=1 Tax=Methylobacter marinus TaxID=34058 RepID=UPI0003759B43|nr:MdtA/MuxA family multidrug efflux RND transporter periplasmic adaptor subunit [Methylobacter marinus]